MLFTKQDTKIMLGKNTIDKVDDLLLSEVIGKYVKLKKSGSSYTAKSPFVEEKTPSFNVSDSKGVWKCFSSGKGGGSGVSFVMEFKTISYPEAIKEIADAFGIEIEYDDTDRQKEYLRRNEQKKGIYDANALALEYFISNIDKIPADKKRAQDKSYEKFQLGYAPEGWNGLINFLKSKGVSYDLMLRSALITESSNKPGQYFDFFRGRIMFPIFSPSGKILGFSGRNIVKMETPEGEKKFKVFNSRDTEAYHKCESLLGFYQAIPGIQFFKYATLVEGNFDVTAMHEAGLINTFGSLGTALTKEQAELIRKYTDTVCIFADNDSAGRKSLDKNTRILLELGFKVFCFVPEGEGMDPDDLWKSKEWKDEEFKEMFDAKKQDAVEYLAAQLFKDATTPIKTAAAESEVIKLLSIISDPQLRNAYVKSFNKEYKIERKSVEEGIKIEVASRKVPEDDNKRKLPSFLKEDDIKDFEEFGFYEDHVPHKMGYYFANGSFGFERVTNFLISPLFQVSSMKDSKRIIEIRNEKKKSIIIMPNKSLVSPQQFEEIVMNEGNFDFQASAKQFKKIRQKMLAKFPFCMEIKTLGWQKAGFYAFANGIINDGFKKSDSYGICLFGNDQYFLPAFSSVFSHAQEEDDEYEADRFFVYKPSSLNFSEWSAKMIRVHQDNGMWSSLFVIASIFRDHIYSCLSYFPHLYGFGQVQTGKSTCARSVNSIFFHDQVAFNLSSGTNVGFYRRMARCKNAVVWFDEYSNDIEERRFQALKASYDGTGHERGVMSKDNRTESTKINSASFITGQYIPTRDGNALLTRIIMLTFDRKQQDLSIDDIAAFKELKMLEKKGLSNLIQEIVKYRATIEDDFSSVNFEVVSQFKNDLNKENYVGRIMENYAILCTIYKLVGDKLNLPFTYEQVYKQALDKTLKQSEQVTDSDQLREFWKIVENLSRQGAIVNGHDYKVEEANHVTIRDGRKGTSMVKFNVPSKVFYIRLSTVHSEYMKEHRKQFGENGVPEQSILSYMKSSKDFIGNCQSTSFSGNKTSAYAFLYDELNISMKNANPISEDENAEQNLQGVLATKQDDLPF